MFDILVHDFWDKALLSYLMVRWLSCCPISQNFAYSTANVVTDITIKIKKCMPAVTTSYWKKGSQPKLRDIVYF